MQERVNNAFSCTLYSFLSKYSIFLKFALIKSTQWNYLKFFLKACSSIINNNNFRLQDLQVRAVQQRYLKCKCETPNLEGELVPKTCKNLKMSSKKLFLSVLVTKLENLLVLGRLYLKISSNWRFKKKLADQSHFGLNI